MGMPTHKPLGMHAQMMPCRLRSSYVFLLYTLPSSSSNSSSTGALKPPFSLSCRKPSCSQSTARDMIKQGLQQVTVQLFMLQSKLLDLYQAWL